MLRVVIAIVMFVVLFRVGLTIIRVLAQPTPAPPDPGEMRRVNLQYRCAVCGAEAKMTRATDEEPEPPRHCMEDMELVAQAE